MMKGKEGRKELGGGGGSLAQTSSAAAASKAPHTTAASEDGRRQQQQPVLQRTKTKSWEDLRRLEEEESLFAKTKLQQQQTNVLRHVKRQQQ